jgi:protein-L-isoaspartate O-methyltransferase
MDGRAGQVILPLIPTAISPIEARFMQEVVRGKVVVEYGALLGFSTIILAEVAAKVISVDRHVDYHGETFIPYMSNLDRYNVRSKVKVIKGDALSHARVPADVAFVDLTGQYHLTKTLLAALAVPLALIHDYGRPFCEVGRAVKDAGWTPIGQVETLLLCEKQFT